MGSMAVHAACQTVRAASRALAGDGLQSPTPPSFSSGDTFLSSGSVCFKRPDTGKTGLVLDVTPVPGESQGRTTIVTPASGESRVKCQSGPRPWESHCGTPDSGESHGHTRKGSLLWRRRTPGASPPGAGRPDGIGSIDGSVMTAGFDGTTGERGGLAPGVNGLGSSTGGAVFRYARAPPSSGLMSGFDDTGTGTGRRVPQQVLPFLVLLLRLHLRTLFFARPHLLLCPSEQSSTH